MDPSSREHASKAEPSHARAPGRVKEALCRCPYPLLEAFGTHIVCGPICSRELGRKFKREFYKDDLLKAFLFDRDFAELPKNRFIDYARYLNYYASDIKETTLKMGEASKRARLPYQEVINFCRKAERKDRCCREYYRVCNVARIG